MVDFIIEDGISIPKKERKRKYPWLEMKNGQSFHIDHDDVPKQKNGHYVSIVAPANRRYAPKKFVSRKDETGLRIWRVE